MTLGLAATYRPRDTKLLLRLIDGDRASPLVETELGDFLYGAGISAADCSAALATASGPSSSPLQEEANPAFRAARLAAFPKSLKGKSVLDIGGYDGEWAEECFRRGATSYTILDNGEFLNYHWVVPPRRSGVRFVGCDALEWQEAADIVVAYNVYYHVHDPWRFFWHLRTLTRKRLLLCGPIESGTFPGWKIVDPDEDSGKLVDGRFTVYWRPTESGLLRLLKRTGWSDIQEAGRINDHLILTASPQEST